MTKTGKLFFTCIVFVLVTLNTLNTMLKATLALEVCSVEGIPLKRVAVECECNIQVTLQVNSSGQHDYLSEFVLEDNNKQFEILDRTQSQSFFIINGMKKNIYTLVYRAKARKSGIAYLKALTKSEQSNTRTVLVTDSIFPQAAASILVPSCELVVDQTDLVIGETQAFVVRFYAKKPYTAELQTTRALPDALKITNLEGPHYSLARNDNKNIYILEWQGYMTPQQEGVYTIPELLVRYCKQHTQLIWPFNYAQPKKLSTAPVQLIVRAVPTRPGGVPTQFVGKLVSFKSNLESTILVQGQATTFTLTLEGTGNTDVLTAPELRLPEELSCYAPHCTQQQLKEGDTRVTWHYVLQARAPGSIQVPAQEFAWFDTQERTCKQMSTDSYTITITPAPDNNVDLETNSQEELTTLASTDEQEARQEAEQEDLDSSITSILQVQRVHPALAWGQFYILLCLPFGFWLLSIVALFVTNGRGQRLYYYYTAYYRARKSLRQAQEKHQAWLIYALFRHYIGDRLELDHVSTPTYEYLCSCMRTKFTQDEYKQWCKFLQESMHVSAYAPRNTNQRQDTSCLFTAAQAWLVRVRARL